MKEINFKKPTEIGGYPVDFVIAHPETGGIDVMVWRDARRDEGVLINCRDWNHVHRLVANIKAVMEGRV